MRCVVDQVVLGPAADGIAGVKCAKTNPGGVGAS